MTEFLIDDFESRLARVVKDFGGVRAFLEACAKNGTKISETGLRAYLKGSEPTRPVLVGMAKTAGVDLCWLATGDGSPHGQGADESDNSYSLPIAVPQQRSSMRRVITGVTLDRGYITENFSDPKNLALVFFDSDVMTPNISPGSTLIIDRANTEPTEGIYYIKIGSAPTCRRYVFYEKHDVDAWYADNEAYPFIEVDRHNPRLTIEVIGRVVGAIRMNRV